MKLFLLSLKKYLRKLDWVLLTLAVVSSGYGLVLVYSATRTYSTSTKMMLVQGGAVLLGILIFFVVSSIDLENISNLWIPLLILNLLFLASVLVLGTAGDSGNRSWIRFGPIGIQPGEIGRLIFLLTFAKHISVRQSQINHPRTILELLAHGGITVAFAYVFSKDLGMAITYVLIMAIMLLFSGISFKWLVPMALSALATAPIIWRFLGKYQKLRILVVFDPSVSDQYAYQAKQGKIAIGSGKLWGQGLLQGRQTQYSILPAKHTDFIFAVAGEELGLIGCTAIILLLSAICFKLFYNACKMNSNFSFMLTIGIGAMFMVQTLINIAMCVGLAPVIGVTLPFFSYGGTSIVTFFCALGMASSVLVYNRPKRVS